MTQFGRTNMGYFEIVTITNNHIISAIILRVKGEIMKIFGYMMRCTRVNQPGVVGVEGPTCIEMWTQETVQKIVKATKNYVVNKVEDICEHYGLVECKVDISLFKLNQSWNYYENSIDNWNHWNYLESCDLIETCVNLSYSNYVSNHYELIDLFYWLRWL